MPEKPAWRLRAPTWLGRPVSWGLLLGAVAGVGLAVAIFVAVGGVNVSADRPDGWATRNLLHFVFKRSMSLRARDLTAPADLAAPGRIRLAAQHFDMVCANCHGRPGYGQSVTALSMSPRPQYLPYVVGQFTDGELHQIVEHGVKFSAMPAWPTDARADEVWSMVAFLRQLPKMDAKTYRDLTALPQVAWTGPAGPTDASAPRPADARLDAPPANEFSYLAPSAGFADAALRENPVPTCARCHGTDGSGAATGGEAPNLTLQDAPHLQAALIAYTQGRRRSGFMRNIATELSTAQVAALATYYAGLPVKASPGAPADPALTARGQQIAFQGVRERAIPPCADCHESAGEAVSHAPHIAGQNATYLRRQLAAMAHGGRGGASAWNPMLAVAHDLGDKDIAAVAAYYAGLTPVRAAGGGATTLAQAPIPWTSAHLDLASAQRTFQTTCVKCHLGGGQGDPQGNYPDLTLQTTPYLAQSLYAFRWGSRASVKMHETTDPLTWDQLTSLAAYVNALPARPAGARPDPAAAARGAAIAQHGAPGRGVPACLGCHGAQSVAALPLIPRLQGQNVAYLTRRLNAFAKPYVRVTALNPMPAIAGPLTDAERADLAAYFAAAPPLEKTPASR
jgi:cytochrome c553